MKRHFCFEVNKSRELLFDFQFLVYNQLNNSFFKASEDFGCFKYLTLDVLKNLNSDDIKWKNRIIPIGSIEFVVEWFEKFYNITLRPLNIPNQLWKSEFLNRECVILSKNELFSRIDKGLINHKVFVKSNTKFKSICDIYTGKSIKENQDKFTDDFYLVSNVVNILAEYRVFVFKGKIQDVRRYSGDYTVTLSEKDFSLINKMIEEFKDAPVAYTLDVGLKFNRFKPKRDLFLIEVHDFFSVGLYGFDCERVPYMFSQWFYWKLKQEGIKF